jgi:ATP-dependent DNA helicase RecQ
VPEEAGLAQALHQLLDQGAEFDISRYDLSRSTDVRPLVLETVITYLEQENVLEPLGAIYTTFQIGFLRPQKDIVAGFSPDRRAFLESLFAAGRQGRRWLTLDVADAASALGAAMEAERRPGFQSRDRMLKALHYLEENGAIELKPSGVRHRYRLLAGAANRQPSQLARWLAEIFSKRENTDLGRLDQVVALALDPGCTTRALLAYFGETLADCGHCGHCLSRPAANRDLPRHPPRKLSQADLQILTDLRARNLPALQSPRQLARFLCGITSPATSRDRLGGNPAFGAFDDVPFQQVLEACARHP